MKLIDELFEGRELPGDNQDAERRHKELMGALGRIEAALHLVLDEKAESIKNYWHGDKTGGDFKVGDIVRAPKFQTGNGVITRTQGKGFIVTYVGQGAYYFDAEHLVLIERDKS